MSGPTGVVIGTVPNVVMEIWEHFHFRDPFIFWTVIWAAVDAMRGSILCKDWFKWPVG